MIETLVSPQNEITDYTQTVIPVSRTATQTVDVSVTTTAYVTAAP